MNEKPSDIARHITDELAACGVKLVASLPRQLAHGRDRRARSRRPVRAHPGQPGGIGDRPVSGAYMGAMGSAALMGASGFMTVIYAHHQDQLHL